ncbi:MAG: ion transporter, partial [Planctomycetota bacterium]|nr:ion transporter [Planctomycetota bacterium]
IPESARLLEGVGRALKASVGLLLVLILFNLILGLAACHFFGEAAPQYFGDPLVSMYSMFKVFTVEGWYEIPDQIAAQAGPLAGYGVRAFFVMAVLTGGILGLTLTTAVFVDEMVMDNNAAVEKQLRAVQDELAEIKALLTKAPSDPLHTDSSD